MAVSSSATYSSATFKLHMETSDTNPYGWADITSIGGFDVNVRGGSGDQYLLNWSCTGHAEADGYQPGGNLPTVSFQGCKGPGGQGNFDHTANDSGVITGTLAGGNPGDYRNVATFGHWIDLSQGGHRVADLIVNVSVRIVRPNQRPPVAIIAPPVPADPLPDTPVTLDGSGSYSPDGNSLVEYKWTIQDPNAAGGSATQFGPVIQHSWQRGGTYAVTLMVTDDDGLSGSTTTTIAVRSRPPLILNCPAGAGIVGIPYTSAFSASGGAPPYAAFSITSGTLPPMLVLNAFGGISGTPTQVGTYPFTGSVTDSVGSTTTTNCTIAITQPPCTFSLSYSSKNFSTDGGNTGVGVTASDVSCPVFASSPVDWVLFSGPLPQHGSGTVFYTVESNSGPKRQTTVTVANQPLTITQDGVACSANDDISPLPVADFKQCGNPFQTQWWDDPYDSNGATICEDGCALTAIADVLTFYGYSYTPKTLNTALLSIGSQGFAGGLVVWDAIASVTNGGLHFKGFLTKTDVDAQLCAGHPVIVDLGGHFVVVTGKVNGQYTIKDPGTTSPAATISTFVSGRGIAP